MCWNIFETTMCGMPALRSLQGKQLRSTCNVCINTFVHCGGLTFDKVADLFVTNFDMKYSTKNLFGTLDCCTFYALLINSNNFYQLATKAQSCTLCCFTVLSKA